MATNESERHDRHGPSGQFIHSLPVSMDLVNKRAGTHGGVGKTKKEHVDGVEFHPFNIDVLEEVIERAKGSGNDHIMLAVETVSTKDGATTGWVLGYDEYYFGRPKASRGDCPDVWIGSGATYSYAGDEDE